jgi:hypothetical protein
LVTQDWLRAADLERVVKLAEVEACKREGITTAEAQRVNELEREVEELCRANEMLELASAFFAQAAPPSEILRDFIENIATP